MVSGMKRTAHSLSVNLPIGLKYLKANPTNANSLLFRNIYIDQIVFSWLAQAKEAPQVVEQLPRWYRRKIDFTFDYGGLSKPKKEWKGDKYDHCSANP